MVNVEKINQRIREVLKDEKGIKEKNMFGGIIFTHNGNMLCRVDKKHGLILRVGPEQYEKVLKIKHARKMDITGKPMKGFIFVDAEGYEANNLLKEWLDRGIAFTKTLPKK